MTQNKNSKKKKKGNTAPKKSFSQGVEPFFRFLKNETFHFIVGFILAHSRHGVSDSFIAERIEALIEKNELNVIKRAKKREDYYRDTILKRAKDFDYTTLNLNKNVCSDPDL